MTCSPASSPPPTQTRPVESAELLGARAEAGRAAGRPDPEEYARRPRPGTRSAARSRPARMRWRAAEASPPTGDREAGADAARAAHATAVRLGAGWLRGEIEHLAARARLALHARAGDRRPRWAGRRPRRIRSTSPPRERQVLALLGRGRHQPRDRSVAVHGREDGQRARIADPHEAQCALADRGGRGGAPAPADRSERHVADRAISSTYETRGYRLVATGGWGTLLSMNPITGAMMETTRSDRSPSAALAIGTMLMGDNTPAEEAHRMLDRFRRRRGQPRRHRRRYSDGGSERNARAVARRPPRRGRARHQVPLRGLRSGREGPRTGPDRQGRLRREPAPHGRRRDRPLPGACARSRRAAGGDARGARRPRPRRQGPRARRLQLPAWLLAWAVAVQDREGWAPFVSCSRSTRSSSARSRLSCCRSAAPPGSASSRGARWAPASSAASTRAASVRPPAAGSPTPARPGGGLRPAGDRAPLPRRRRSGRDRRGARRPIPQVALAWLLGYRE